MMRTLLLDSAYYPVKIINWQKAMVLFLCGRANVVEEYDDVLVRSINQNFNLPKILRLNGRFRKRPGVKFSRHNIFWRDDWTCQYCSTSFHEKELTFDHVRPRSKGGATSWQNVVTACKGCNNKKGDKLLDDISMCLIKVPKQPKWVPLIGLQTKETDPDDWEQWIQPKSIKKRTG